MEMKDLAIIGAGPSGSSAAVTAARLGAKVALLEAHSFPRQKVCGEFVSAESLDAAINLLRDVPAAATVLKAAPVIDRTRLFLGKRFLQAPVSPPGLSIARFELDALLWEAAIRAGVEAKASCEVTAIEGTGPFMLTTTSGSYAARALIVAAGRWNQFTEKEKRIAPQGPKWIGLKAHFREQSPPPSTDLYFFENGYCGVQPVGSDAINACAMVRSDVATCLEEVFASHPMLSRRAFVWKPLMQPVSTAPLVYHHPQPTIANVLYVGDAACFIDPFVGDGISIALRSGRLAAQCLQGFWRGAARLSGAVANYQHEYSRHFAPLFSAASRLRWLLGLPSPARAAAFELMRLPGVMPLVIRKTRQAA
jgi:flavin-dependent dehydrogenase